MTPESSHHHLISISRIQVHDGYEVSVLSLRGAIRGATADEFRSRLSEAADRALHLVVDLSELGYINSSGLGILLEQNQLQLRRGGWLRLAAPSPTVRMILELSGVADVLTPRESVESVLRELEDRRAA